VTSANYVVTILSIFPVVKSQPNGKGKVRLSASGWSPAPALPWRSPLLQRSISNSQAPLGSWRASPQTTRPSPHSCAVSLMLCVQSCSRGASPGRSSARGCSGGNGATARAAASTAPGWWGSPRQGAAPSRTASQREPRQAGRCSEQSLIKLCNIQKVQVSCRWISILKGWLLSLTLGLLNILPEFLQEETKA